MKSLVVSLHDASPHTRAACEQIVAELASLGVHATSLLVVPDHHHRGHFLKDAAFCEWLRDLSRKGHEPVIHGYYHQRSRRDAESLFAKMTTRIYTADEGEFYDIARSEAARLIAKAREEFRSIGLEPRGFIAPAWLLSREGEAAARELGLDYTTRLGGVLELQRSLTHDSQSLVWSVRSAWRRVVSLAWNGLLFQRLKSAPLLRVAIHPVDLQHGEIWRQIRQLVAQALQTREPLTYERWLTATRENAADGAAKN